MAKRNYDKQYFKLNKEAAYMRQLKWLLKHFNMIAFNVDELRDKMKLEETK